MSLFIIIALMIHFQNDVIKHLTNGNLSKDGKPIIKVGDLIVFTEGEINSKVNLDYKTFSSFIDMYFEYTEHGNKENRLVKITGLLTKYQ